jgi:hypothetical protein
MYFDRVVATLESAAENKTNYMYSDWVVASLESAARK